MEGITGHYDKIVLTLIMCLVILFMATFSPIAESANAFVAVPTAIIAIIIAGLAAVGITFVTTGAYDNLNDYVESLFNEFAEDNNTTVNQLLSGTQSGTDKLGRILINNKFVILIDTFGSWLKAKYSLTNNDIITVVSEGASIGNLTCYNVPMIITDNGAVITYIYSSNPEVGAVLTFWNQGNYTPMLISNAPTSFVIQSVRVSTGEIDTWTTNTSLFENSSWYVAYGYQIDKNAFSNSINLVGYSYNTIREELTTNNGILINDVGIIINTGDIVLPTDNEDYVDGDGAVIDVDADWGTTYQDVIDDVIPDDFSDSKEGEASIEYVAEEEVAEAVEDTSEITNLPAGTIPFTPLQLPQFHLADIWHYVAQWLEDTAIAAGALMAIVVQEPHPMVNLFYATVCLAIIFGVIKGLAK